MSKIQNSIHVRVTWVTGVWVCGSELGNMCKKSLLVWWVTHKNFTVHTVYISTYSICISIYRYRAHRQAWFCWFNLYFTCIKISILRQNFAFFPYHWVNMTSQVMHRSLKHFKLTLPCFHCMVRLGSARLDSTQLNSTHSFLVFHGQLWIVPGTFFGVTSIELSGELKRY